MKLIIGLGNPGEKYKNNRHNVGHMVVDSLESQIRNSKTEIRNKFKLLKSNNFMNDSGSFVLSQYTKYHIPYTSLFVVHDDLDIKLGEFKIQLGRGPKIHNGLNDIYEKLGTKDFCHVRVGVDNRDPENRIPGEDYVLQDFTNEEKTILDNVIKDLCKKLVIL
jgi:PTH1 family peptidyl-tRNA hydrolase